MVWRAQARFSEEPEILALTRFENCPEEPFVRVLNTVSKNVSLSLMPRQELVCFENVPFFFLWWLLNTVKLQNPDIITSIRL